MLSVRSLTAFEEIIVVTVLTKLVRCFFISILVLFFLTPSLIDRCQIVTDTYKNNVPKFDGSLLNHLYRYANKNVSVKLLSSICITSISTTIY